MKYKIGDKVKIISLEKVRSYPKDKDGVCMIGDIRWTSRMDEFAGTVQLIREVEMRYYHITDWGYVFSPEMIEGPADSEELTKLQEEIKDWTDKMHNDSSHIAVYLRKADQEKLAHNLADLGWVRADNYAERLERFVLAVAAGRYVSTAANAPIYAQRIISHAVELLAAFEDEIKKHRI